MKNPAKLLILLMVAAGLGAGALGVWYRHGQMSQVLKELSPPVAELMVNAPEAELARLEPIVGGGTAEDGEVVEIDGRRFRVVDRRGAADSKALGNLRKALLQNASYQWHQPASEAPGQWSILVLIRRGDDEARLAFDPAGWLWSFNSGRAVSIAPVTPGLKQLLREQFPEMLNQQDEQAHRWLPPALARLARI